MYAELPWQLGAFRLTADFPALDATEKCTGETGFARITFTVDSAEIEKLVAEGVLLFLLGEDGLEGEGQLAQAGGLGPGMFLFELLGKEAAAATGALCQAGQELVTKGLDKRLHLIGFDLVAGVHDSPC
jgi:hypothetical protein